MRTLLYEHETLTIHSVAKLTEPNYLFIKLLGEFVAEIKYTSSGAVRKLAEMPLFDEDVEVKKAFAACIGWADEQDKRKLGLNEDRFDLAHPSEQMDLKDCWLIWCDRDQGWWRTGGGYTGNILHAGIYTELVAEELASGRRGVDSVFRLTDAMSSGKKPDITGTVGKFLGVLS